jgi:hypothetical protein
VRLPADAAEWFIAALVAGFALAFVSGLRMAVCSFGAFQWAGF